MKISDQKQSTCKTELYTPAWPSSGNSFVARHVAQMLAADVHLRDLVEAVAVLGQHKEIGASARVWVIPLNPGQEKGRTKQCWAPKT